MRSLWRLQVLSGAFFAAVLLPGSTPWAAEAGNAPSNYSGSLLVHDNLIAWEPTWGAGGKQRSPKEMADILKSVGFTRYGRVILNEEDPASLDAEIDAMQAQGVTTFASFFWVGDDPKGDPQLHKAFEVFRRHGVHPLIWVAQSSVHRPKTPIDWAKAGLSWPKSLAALTPVQAETFFETYHRIDSELERLPKTSQEQKERVDREAERIKALVELAAPYGLTVQLYNHNGWFGLMENQLAILERLEQLSVRNVGLVYTFWHARDVLHDDVKHFAQVWKKIQRHVAVVNISGVRGELETLYPSQGDDELGMLRIIEASGWYGPVGVLCWNVVDPEAGLKAILTGTDWVAAELKQPRSGGPRPSPSHP